MDAVGNGWRKSSYSGGNGGDCIEVGTEPGMILVRDSKDTDGTVLTFGREAWSAFAARVKAELDPRATSFRGALWPEGAPLRCAAWRTSPSGWQRCRS